MLRVTPLGHRSTPGSAANQETVDMTVARRGPAGGSHMPAWLPRLNTLIVNPVQRLWAPYLPPYALVLHRGRKTGTDYRTPVVAFKHGHRIIIALPYGDQTNWIRNLEATGSGQIIRRGRRLTIRGMLVTDGTTDADRLPPRLRRVLRRLRILIIDTSS
jgi:deazaflavin-dependent oxidoreductase (nitroreductase family)